MNIVRINESIFSAFNVDQRCGFCWRFTYARKDYANLQEDQECCVHVFMEDFTSDDVYRDNIKAYTQHEYTLKILTDSFFDIQIFNELDPDDAKSKFADYIEPQLSCFPEQYHVELCKLELEQVKSRTVAVYNRKDQNKDGIEYKVTVRDEFN